jgi:hypothetical protein
MTARWQLRAWLLTFQGTLTVALFTEKIDKNAFLWAAIAGTAIAWALEMSENFVIAKAIDRQAKIERVLRDNNYTAESPPTNFHLLFTCGTLQETAQGWPTVVYIFSCLGKFRRVLILLFFLTLPFVVRFLLT